MSLSSALSITASANPPRAVFTDYPLGHTSGRAHDRRNQHSIVMAALERLRDADSVGTIVTTPLEWDVDDDWKDTVMRPRSTATQGDSSASNFDDDRVERWDTPQYQTPEDAACADEDCPTCIWVT